MKKIYLVTLSDDERDRLQDIINHGKHAAQKRKRAEALLLADKGLKDTEIAERAHMKPHSIEELRKRFVEEGFEATLEGGKRGHPKEKIQGEDEARLTMLACSECPKGHDRWTLRLLAEKFVTLDKGHVSHETIRQVLKKTN
jgi:transposase